MKKLFTVGIAISVAALIAPSAFAQSNDDPHFYGGVAYERISVDANPKINFDSALLRGGYRFSKYFGAEAEIGTSLKSDTVNILGTDVKFKTDLTAAIYGVGFVPLSERFDLVGRVGYKYFDIKAKSPGFSVGSDGYGFAWSVGAQYFLTESQGVRFDFQKTGGDATAYTLGYVIKF